MKYSPENIKSNPRFVLLDELNYDRIVDFTAKYIRKRNPSMVLFYIFMIGSFLLVIGSLVYGVVYHNREFGGIMPDQALYFRKTDNKCAFAMLWPWQSGEHITVKIGNR